MVDHIYIINLEQSKDRKIRFEKQLKALNVSNYSFFKAICPTDQEYKKYKPTFIGSKGALGCLLSHMEIYRDALKKNYNNIIVFEDDIDILDKNFIAKTEYYIKTLKDYEVLLLGANHKRPAAKKIMNGVYQTVTSNGTFGYCINKNTMNRLLATENYKFPYDYHWRKFNVRKPIKFYCVVPHLVNVYDTISVINNNNVPTQYAKQILNSQYRILVANFKPPY